MCRVRNTHTSAPWTTAYMCITVDDSCLDENGKYVDKPLTLRMVQWQPFVVKKPFDPKTPVCAACKRTNRTRSFCRERHRHRQLPWCTVYVLLSALDQADPSTVVAGASRQVDNSNDGDEQLKDESEKTTATTDEDSKPRAEDTSTGAGSETISSDVEGEGDDINDIAESRTFLAKVSCRGSSIHWLDLVDYDSNDPQHFEAPENAAAAAAYPPPPPQAMDPNHPQAQYYAHAHYAAHQQHQNALKSHQQFFFQMQQQQQQRQYPGHQGQPPPPPHWQQQQQQQHQYNMGHGEITTSTTTSSPPGATAGEAVRRGHEDGQQQQQHAWMMHYAPPFTAGHFAPPPPPPNDGAPHQEHHPYHHHHHHHHSAETTSDNEVNGDAEDHGVKRQRVV